MNALKSAALNLLLLLAVLAPVHAQETPSSDSSTTTTLSGLPDYDSGAGLVPREDSLRIALNPANGAIHGKRGETIGWGFKVEWTSNVGDRLAVTESKLVGGYSHISTTPYTDVITRYRGNTNDFVVSGVNWEQDFQSEPPATGVGFLTIRPDAVIGAQYTGQVQIAYSVFSNDTDNPRPIARFAALFDVTVTVDAPDPVPVVDQVITFPQIADKFIGDAPMALTASSDRNLPITFESLTPSVCTVTNGVLTVIAAGTCTIEASQGGDDATNPAQPVTQTFEVRKVPATVTITGSGTRSYNGLTQTMTAVTDPPGLTVMMLYDGQETPPSEPGIYTVQARIIDPMYEGSATATLSNVAPSNAAPTDIALSNNVIAELNALGATIGTLSTTDPDAGDTFTYSLESGALDNDSFAIAGNLLKLAISADYEAKSSYAVRITSADQNGLVTVKDFSITITDVTLPQSITFPPVGLKTLGTAPFVPDAIGGGSGQPVTFTTTGPATASGSLVTLTGTGTVTITAHQAAGGDYTAAPDVTQSFTVQSAFKAWAAENGLPTDPAANGGVNLQRFAFGLSPTGGSGLAAINDSGGIVSDGFPTVNIQKTASTFTYNALFTRPKNWAAMGLTYTVQFSGDMTTWVTSNATPASIATDSDSEAVIVRYPFFVNGKKARFFQIVVGTAP